MAEHACSSYLCTIPAGGYLPDAELKGCCCLHTLSHAVAPLFPPALLPSQALHWRPVSDTSGAEPLPAAPACRVLHGCLLS